MLEGVFKYTLHLAPPQVQGWKGSPNIPYTWHAPSGTVSNHFILLSRLGCANLTTPCEDSQPQSLKRRTKPPSKSTQKPNSSYLSHKRLNIYEEVAEQTTTKSKHRANKAHQHARSKSVRPPETEFHVAWPQVSQHGQLNISAPRTISPQHQSNGRVMKTIHPQLQLQTWPNNSPRKLEQSFTKSTTALPNPFIHPNERALIIMTLPKSECQKAR